jgi:hypothetical protein
VLGGLFVLQAAVRVAGSVSRGRVGGQRRASLGHERSHSHMWPTYASPDLHLAQPRPMWGVLFLTEHRNFVLVRRAFRRLP